MKHQPILISGARVNGSATDGPAAKHETFISYEIQSERGTAKRRYSEFELLQAHLRLAHPLMVIPPIPEKENISDLVNYIKSCVGIRRPEGPSQQIIQHRIRTLQMFLDYLQDHPVLSTDSTFLDFLTENVNWSKSSLVLQEGSVNGKPALACKESGSTIGLDNPRLVSFLDKINAFQTVLQQMERTHRKIMRNLKESSKAYADMGQTLNAFSLQYSALQEPLEESGLSLDTTGSDLQDLIGAQEIVTETLGFCDDFCKAAHKTILNHAKASDEAIESLQEETQRVVEAVNKSLERVLRDACEAQSSHAQKVRKLLSPERVMFFRRKKFGKDN